MHCKAHHVASHGESKMERDGDGLVVDLCSLILCLGENLINLCIAGLLLLLESTID